MICNRTAQRRTIQVTTAESRQAHHAAVNTLMPCTSSHRRTAGRLDAAPCLAARALPVVRTRAESTALAAIAGRAHDQLVGDLLERGQRFFGRNRSFGQAEVDQGCLALDRGPLTQLLRQEVQRRLAALLALQQ